MIRWVKVISYNNTIVLSTLLNEKKTMDTKDKKIEFVQYMRDDMCEMIDSLVQHALWRQLRIQWFLFSIVLYFFPLSTHKSYISKTNVFQEKVVRSRNDRKSPRKRFSIDRCMYCRSKRFLRYIFLQERQKNAKHILFSSEYIFEMETSGGKRPFTIIIF